jgi:hypothetical protein
VYHDLGLRLVSWLGSIVLVFCVIAHLNIVVTIATLFLIKIILIVVTLCLKIFTLGIGDLFFVILLASSGLGAFHLMVIALGRLVGLLELLEERSLKLALFGAVGSTVIVETISLGLVRWVLCGGRVIRVPMEKREK